MKRIQVQAKQRLPVVVFDETGSWEAFMKVHILGPSWLGPIAEEGEGKIGVLTEAEVVGYLDAETQAWPPNRRKGKI